MSYDNSNSAPDINRVAPTPFEIAKALAVARLLIEAFEAGEDPPEFAEAYSDDLDVAFEAGEASLPTLEQAAIAYRRSRYGR